MNKDGVNKRVASHLIVGRTGVVQRNARMFRDTVTVQKQTRSLPTVLAEN